MRGTVVPKPWDATWLVGEERGVMRTSSASELLRQFTFYVSAGARKIVRSHRRIGRVDLPRDSVGFLAPGYLPANGRK